MPIANNSSTMGAGNGCLQSFQRLYLTVASQITREVVQSNVAAAELLETQERSDGRADSDQPPRCPDPGSIVLHFHETKTDAEEKSEEISNSEEIRTSCYGCTDNEEYSPIGSVVECVNCTGRKNAARMADAREKLLHVTCPNCLHLIKSNSGNDTRYFPTAKGYENYLNKRRKRKGTGPSKTSQIVCGVNYTGIVDYETGNQVVRQLPCTRLRMAETAGQPAPGKPISNMEKCYYLEILRSDKQNNGLLDNLQFKWRKDSGSLQTIGLDERKDRGRKCQCTQDCPFDARKWLDDFRKGCRRCAVKFNGQGMAIQSSVYTCSHADNINGGCTTSVDGRGFINCIDESSEGLTKYRVPCTRHPYRRITELEINPGLITCEVRILSFVVF